MNAFFGYSYDMVIDIIALFLNSCGIRIYLLLRGHYETNDIKKCTNKMLFPFYVRCF